MGPKSITCQISQTQHPLLDHIKMVGIVHTLTDRIVHLLETLNLPAEVHKAVLPDDVVVRVGLRSQIGPALLQAGKVMVFPLHAGIDWALQGLQVQDLPINLSVLVLVLNVIDRTNKVFDFICQFLNLCKEIRSLLLDSFLIRQKILAFYELMFLKMRVHRILLEWRLLFLRIA